MTFFKNRLWKTSIKYKFVLASTLFIGLTVFLCWIVFKNFLIFYYEYSRTELLGDTYNQINEIYDSDIFDFEDGFTNPDIREDVALIFERLSTNKNISLYIFDIYYNEHNIFLNVSYPPPKSLTNNQREILSSRVEEYYTNDADNQKEKNLLKKSPRYNIYRVFDNRMNSQYIELFGSLNNGSTIYLRTNLESMQESVNIANNFLGVVGIFASVIGIIIMYFISRSFTKPVLDLSDIAQRMSNLDFDVKYNVNTTDEIGTLGTSINTLSEKLERTISELKSANNELKTDIQKRTEIDEVRKEFLSNVSHELKTPIALIQGYAEGLKENINDDEENRNFYCEVIMDEADKMNRMVKKLLTLNQIEFGNDQLSIERFNIVLILESVIDSTDILFKQKDVKLEFDQKEPVYVWADEYMIEEVITNYISNALNHVSGANVIKVDVIKKETTVRVSIFNTGNNIPEEELDKIWDKFYKVDKARTREYGGSGIGLSIVKAIMDSMNQECGVNNCEDGVEFWFELDANI